MALLFSWLLVGPVPAVLARATWPQTVPRAALALWHTVALAILAGLMVIGVAAIDALLVHPAALPWPWLAGAGALLCLIAFAAAIHFFATVVALTVRSRRVRRRQRHLAALLHEQPAGPPLNHARPGVAPVLVVGGQGRFVYCIPGRSPRIVMSTGALRTLTSEQRVAVVSHEWAHLRGRHHLMVGFFAALHRAFPLPSTRAALRAVQLLVEMLADDAARRVAGNRPLMDALYSLSPLHRSPMDLPGERHEGDPDAATTRRLRRLMRLGTTVAEAGDTRNTRPASWPTILVAAHAYILSIAVLAVPIALGTASWIQRHA
ncbi:M56 family metallopeptidase [Kineosporiaceae bacterium SCSIO 59966]|nr:M56 family metallopeptidase [Kineosporiaceae bacterium SCSIO 59966]